MPQGNTPADDWTLLFAVRNALVKAVDTLGTRHMTRFCAQFAVGETLLTPPQRRMPPSSKKHKATNAFFSMRGVFP